MTNRDISKILKEISIILEMDDVAFKPRAYDFASQTVGGLDKEIKEIYKKGGKKALDDLPHIGKHIAEKIEELLKTGKLGYYKKLKKKYPVDVLRLSAIEGIGPKMIKTLYKKLKIKNVEDLEKAARKGKIQKLSGFREKTEENILKSITFLRKSGDRFALGFIYSDIEKIVETLNKVPGTIKVEIAGSARRMKETIGDLDLIAVSSKPEKLMDAFIHLKGISKVAAHGRTKSMIRLNSGLDVDLRIIGQQSFGSALSYFTGSRSHSIAMRTLAQKKGLTLNEYGLFKDSKRKKDGFADKDGNLTPSAKKRYIAGKTEKELYNALGLQFIPPELREDAGEIEIAQKKKIPRLIGYEELKGDLQVQTKWSDGHGSIEEIAKKAIELDLKYIVITDHTKALAFAGGLDEKKLTLQAKEIDKINKKLKGKIKILKGAEVNILKDGSLDIKDEMLKKLDVVGAAVHSNFRMTKKQMTERICKAMQNPHVDIIFHPTGRIIQKRQAYDVDIDAIIKMAKKTKTVLEANAFPSRLDLKDIFIKKAVEAGVKLSIDSDAHDPSHMEYLKFGIGQVRRGWARSRDVVNTLPVKQMLRALKKGK